MSLIFSAARANARDMLMGLSLVLAPAAMGATYVVPASDDLIEPVEMSISHTQAPAANGETTLRYRMPREMDGHDAREIEVKGRLVDGVGTLTGSDDEHAMEVTATCADDDGKVVCEMKYLPQVVLDEAASERYLVRRFDRNPAMLEKFRRARMSLMRQSIGFVKMRRAE